jgi:SpoVK/Ycf46/Vps4 family AAA+-type ATPase
MYFCSARVEGYHRISFDCLGNIYSTQKEKKNNEIAFLYGEHLLFKMGIIEEAGTDFRGRNSYTLTDKYEKILLSGIKLKKEYHSLDNFLKNPEDIHEKELYYPREIQEKVSELLDFFNIEKYKGIRERLRDSGLQTGFTCLFYGDPGTGKTETVYQIAKRTGRPIFSIDMSTIRSKWVGDSEKILASYFERYQNYIESHEVEPILLFNEADAIIGKRLENVLGSVDKMENTLQNILLQKMEDFDGILIATTNLQGNLDRAFDRRFLYKIKFSKPTPEIRSRLWINKVSGINETLASRLSQEYDLSGGQIDNISRKHMISRVLYGDRDITYEELKGYCDEEVIESRQKIGF